jgi:putative PIN family toxin of toxin-antitoxin system
VTLEDVRRFLAALAREAEWIEVTSRIAVCRDPKDNMFLELGVDGRATYIVTGDADLLALHPYRGIAILAPHAFLKLALPSAP